MRLSVQVWELPLQETTLPRPLPDNRSWPCCRCGVCLLGAAHLLPAEGASPGSLPVSCEGMLLVWCKLLLCCYNSGAFCLRQPTCVLFKRMTRSWLTEVSVQYRSQSSRSVAVVHPSCFCMLRTAVHTKQLQPRLRLTRLLVHAMRCKSSRLSQPAPS